MSILNGIRALIVLVTTCAITSPAFADAYPTKPIRFIIPYAAGGSNDTIARLVGQVMSVSLGHPIVIENRPGGSTLIGVAAAASAEPDGYTLLYTSSLALNELLYAAKSNKTRDLAPIALMVTLPMVVAVNPSIPSSLKDLIDYAKKNPTKISYPTFGKGTLAHLACEQFAMAVGIKMTDIPYRGGAPAIQDTVRGELQLICDTLTMMEHVRAGTLKTVGLMSSTRSPIAPDIPTFAELGYPSILENISHGFYAPAGTPREIIDRLNQEANKALKDASVLRGIQTFGGTPGGGAPEVLTAALEGDRMRWSKVIKDLNLDLSQ